MKFRKGIFSLLVMLGICGCGKAPAVVDDDASQREYISKHSCSVLNHYPGKSVWDIEQHAPRMMKPWTMYECKNPDVFLHPDDY